MDEAIKSQIACGRTQNFKVVIPEECSFDRFEFAHAASLFDLNCKYADVISVGEVVAHLSKPGELSKAN